MTDPFPQPGLVALLGETPQLYVTVPQLFAVALLAGGVIMLTWAFRRGSSPASPPSPPKPASQPEPLAEYMADARELADLLADRLDRQAHRIERLLAEADEKIRRLERLQSENGPAAARPGRPETDPLNQRVYELADTGLPPVEIARRLQQHTGKVELILALRRR